MTTEIRPLAENCETCQPHKPRNQKETLKQHEEGETVWSKIGVDLFEIKGRSYLVTVDYYSDFGVITCPPPRLKKSLPN